MDEDLRETLRRLAEEHGLDLELLEQAMLSGDIPESLARAMGDVLDDVARFGEAVGKLDE